MNSSVTIILGTPISRGHRARPGHSPQATFVAERGCANFQNPPRVRSCAQSRADVESPRARVPYIAAYEFSPSTVLRTAALQSKPSRSLAAYGGPSLTNRLISHRNLLRAVSPL